MIAFTRDARTALSTVVIPAADKMCSSSGG